MIRWFRKIAHCIVIPTKISQFDNIKLALVVEDQHPHHISFKVDEIEWEDHIVEHRDGSVSKYIQDPSGNKIELIKYKGK